MSFHSLLTHRADVWRKNDIIFSDALVPGTYVVDAQLSDAGYIHIEFSEAPTEGSIIVQSTKTSETFNVEGIDYATGTELFDSVTQIVVSQAAGGTFTVKAFDPSGKQCTVLNKIYSNIRCRVDRERERWSLEPHGRGEAERLRLFVENEDIRVGDLIDVAGAVGERFVVIEGPYVTYDRFGDVHHKTLTIRRAND